MHKFISDFITHERKRVESQFLTIVSFTCADTWPRTEHALCSDQLNTFVHEQEPQLISVIANSVVRQFILYFKHCAKFHFKITQY